MVIGSFGYHGIGPSFIHVNTFRQISAPVQARPGRPFRIQVHSTPLGASGPLAALPLVAAGPLRQELPPLGRLFLDPVLMVGLGAILIDPATGSGERNLVLPASPALQGQTLFFQALVEGREASLPIWRFTGALREVVGPP